MNISIDDTSPNFVWSNGQDDWRAQAPNQVSINNQYFLQTYHASQSKGADVSITFVGAAIQVYGSKGPNHGNYSVTFDNTIKFLPGFAQQTQYRQLLFDHSFGTNLSATHTVILKNEEDYWLDLDFVILTIAASTDTSTSDIGFFTSTVAPGTSVPPSSTSNSDGSSDTTSTSPNIFKNLTFALAAVLGLFIVVLIVWFFISRRRRRSAGSASRTGRDRGASNSSSQQAFGYAQKGGNGPLSTGGGGGTDAGSTVLGFGRGKFGSKEEYARSPTSGGGGSISATEPSRYSRGDILSVGGNNGNNGGAGANTAVSGAAKETLIALNNMGKRPGYRTLAGEHHEGSSRGSLVNIGPDGRETPTSLRTMGSAGQTWIGATRQGGQEEGVRFKGRAGRDSAYRGSGINQRSSSYGSDSNLSARGLQDRRSRALEHIDDSKDEDPYAPSGIGLGMYAANIRSESDQQRMMDLKRTASVASSGILDRLQSSPPPAVPELPPSATTSSSNLSRMQQQQLPPRSHSPESSTVYSHGGVTSGLGLATKVQYPYGRNNEILTHSHSHRGSLNSTSGISTSTGAGSLPLRPPPMRTQAEERERERAQRERERADKEREAAAEREHNIALQRAERYSRPPPEYVPTPTASQVSVATIQGSGGSGAGLQRQGTRTGDIPIGIDGGFGYDDGESQESHSVSLAHAYVGTAQQVSVQPPYHQQQQQQQRQQFQPPPQHHIRRDGQMSSAGSSALGLPHGGATGMSSKRTVTPDRGRSYNPNQPMAAPGERSYTPTGATPVWVGRGSEDSTQVWGLDGAHGGGGSGLGRPIMDDRARLAMGGAGAGGSRRVSRVPPPTS